MKIVTVRRSASIPLPPSLTVNVPGQVIHVAVRTHAKSRRLRLSVTAKGAHVVAPSTARAPAIQAFLNQNASWLVANLKRAVPIKMLSLVPFETGSLPANGQEWPVIWMESDQPKLMFDDKGWVFHLPRNARTLSIARGLLRTQLEAIVRRDLGGDLGPCVTALGRAPVRIDIRAVQSIWGRLSGGDHVLLDLALALAPPATRRYVWIHELCHLAERNHSPRFWAWVARFCPNWKVHRQWLNQSHIKSDLSALMGE